MSWFQPFLQPEKPISVDGPIPMVDDESVFVVTCFDIVMKSDLLLFPLLYLALFFCLPFVASLNDRSLTAQHACFETLKRLLLSPDIIVAHTPTYF